MFALAGRGQTIVALMGSANPGIPISPPTPSFSQRKRGLFYAKEEHKNT